ncbi:MAG: ArsA-related P-loop ATPase, partial [Ilumatobacteraceae bacterium]
MTHAGWLTSSRVLMVAGKGGVGSSTVAAAAALAAARMGADVLFVGVDGRPGMGRLLGGRDLDPTDRVLQRVPGGGQVRGCTVPPDRAFTEYLELKGVGGLLRKAASAASLPMIAAATPGLEYLLVLGAIKEFDRQRRADLIVVDAPPAGHAGPFLASAAGLAGAVRSGPVRDQADEVSEMLTDPTRCGTTLVTLPEETPVNEVVELHHQIHDVVGIADRPLIVNGCWPDRP